MLDHLIDLSLLYGSIHPFEPRVTFDRNREAQLAEPLLFPPQCGHLQTRSSHYLGMVTQTKRQLEAIVAELEGRLEKVLSTGQFRMLLTERLDTRVRQLKFQIEANNL